MKRVRNNEDDTIDARAAVAKRWMSIDYKTLGDSTSESGSKMVSNTRLNGETDRELAGIKPKPTLDVVDLCESETSATETEITSGDDDDESGDLVILHESSIVNSTNSEANSSYSFKLVKSDLYDSNLSSEYFITLRDILYDPHIRKTALFSFQFDMNFLLDQFHHNIEHIVVVAQENTIFPLTDENLHLVSLLDKITTVVIKMPPMSCHHSKLIINQYDNGDIQIFLPSNNLTRGECLYPQQVCWCSTRLSQTHEVSGREFYHLESLSKPSFKTNLLSYLQAYNNETIDKQITPMIENVDFSPLNDVDFVFSVPNRRVESGVKLFQRHVRNYIESIECTPGDNAGLLLFNEHILCQTSTIGGNAKNPRNIFLNTLIPAVSTEYSSLLDGENDSIINKKQGKKRQRESLIDSLKLFDPTSTTNSPSAVVPHIVYPTTNELNMCPYGREAAGWFHFKYTPKTPYFNMMRNKLQVFYKQNNFEQQTQTNRRMVTPCHSKFYIRWREPVTSENPTTRRKMITLRELDWCLYTSANASLSAWGSHTSKTDSTKHIQPRNYEVGVLLHRKRADMPLRCYSFVDLVYGKLNASRPLTDCVIVPFTASLIQYEPGDEPWSTADS